MKKIVLFLSICCLFSVSLFGQQVESVILPKPASVKKGDGEYRIPEKFKIYALKAPAEAGYFIDEVKDVSNICAELVYNQSVANLVLDVDAKLVHDKEGYKLSVGKNQIKITGHDNAGVFYGLQSLIQLVYASGETKVLHAQEINDAPTFSWRSYLVDEARHFKGEKEVYRILDEMAALKMNVLHWHLTDDAGWRIEIKKYPKLTEIGSVRKDTEIVTWGSGKTAGKPHSGFYTQEDVKRILRYAKARHIKVVPEIEMPGHASAAVAAYPWVGTAGKQIEVPITFGKLYPTFNVVDPKVQGFLQDVVDEVLELFETDVIHIGGDEVRFDEWEQSKEVQAWKEKKKFNSFMDIQIDFTNMMSRYISSKGVRMMGWNEILGTALHADDNIAFDDPTEKLADNVIVHYWKGDLAGITKAVQEGYDVVNSHHTFTYLDYTYQSIPLEKAYNFRPRLEGIPTDLQHKIIGIGCQMWSEWASTADIVHRQTFPRIAAYAEVGWTAYEAKDYASFLKRMDYFVARWTKKGINFTPLDVAKGAEK